MAVIEILGSHTLAIISAGAYVRRKFCSLDEYPAIFQEQKRKLLKFHSNAYMSRYENVYKTFEISAKYLQDSGRPEDLDALNLLHIIAFMHNSGISETMFQRAADYVTELQDLGDSNHPTNVSVCHIPRLPEYMQQGWSNNLQDRQRWREARAILASLSLIAVHEINESVELSLHPLVHDWAKERQDRQDQCTAWQSAATILAMSCEGQSQFTPSFVYLQSHVRVCVSHDIQKFTSDISAADAAQLLIQFTYVLYRTHDDRSLISLVPQICLRLENRDGVSIAIGEEVKTFRALVATAKGNAEEATHVLRELVEDRAQRLSEGDPDRLSSEHNLACAYQENGRINEATELLEHVVKVREKLAEDDPSRLHSQHELAGIYLASGRTNEATQLLEHVVKVREKLAEDHPDRLASQHELGGGAYLANGQVEEAIELLELVVKVREKLAEDHPSRLASQHELSGAYLANGQIEEAIELLQFIVKVEEKLAKDHPDRLASQHELARAYRGNGRIDEAIKLLEHVVTIRQQKLAEDHPDRLTSHHELADVYEQSGRIDEAIKLSEHVVKIKQEKLAEDHPSRLMSEHNLAMAYKANGRIEEAIELFEHVVKIERQKLAEDHPDRVISEYGLAETYRANGQVDEAIELFERVVKIERQNLAEDDPYWLLTERALAKAYEAKAQIERN